MHINDEFSLSAAVKEVQALRRLYTFLDAASEEALHPDLSLVEVPDLGDAMVEVSAEIEEREDALSRYRECEVGERRHRASLVWPR